MRVLLLREWAHYNDVTRTWWRLGSQTIQLFVQMLVQTNIKANIKSAHHWPFVTGINWCSLDSPHKGPVMWKAFPCHDIVMLWGWYVCISRRSPLVNTRSDTRSLHVSAILNDIIMSLGGHYNHHFDINQIIAQCKLCWNDCLGYMGIVTESDRISVWEFCYWGNGHITMMSQCGGVSNHQPFDFCPTACSG